MEFQNIIRVLIIHIFLFVWNGMYGQCNPPPAETCEETTPFCSLDEMNGYTCNNPFLTYTTCRPGCARCCDSYRTWWSFVSQGGNVSITFNVGACNSCVTCQYGIVWGIWGDCQCMDEVACTPGCIPTGQSITYNVNLAPCKVYYISADACCYCICDFTINTSGGGQPLSLGDINNVKGGIIEPVCEGACDYKFFVNTQSGCLAPNYVWTLDGQDLNKNSGEIKLDFPDAGDFVLCVSAYIRDPNSGPSCQAGPKCTTVKVRRLSDRIGLPRTLCYEDVSKKAFWWHSQYISSSGIYRQTLTQPNCCKYDSVVEFTVLPEIEPQEFLYISCDNTPYKDPNGFSYPLCTDHLLINLPKATEFHKCDSTILLTSINIGLIPDWTVQCLGGKLELSPNFKIIDTCSVRGLLNVDFKWYLKADTTKQSLGNTEKLRVDTISKDYCLDVNVKMKLGTDSALCIKTFCDTINEATAAASLENIVLRYCDSAIFNGQTYHQTTTFTQQLKTALGCDSIINTILNIQNSSKTDLTFNACDSLNVNGQVYKQSGNYTQLLQSVNSCDSILNIHAEIYRTKFSALFNSACDSVSINGQTYIQTGQYTQLLKTTVGCDSILRIDVDLNKSSNEDLTYNACDSIDINGKVYKQSGKYIQKLFSTHGCDSILNLVIEIQPGSQTDISKTSCDSVIFNGKIYKQSGDYAERYTGSNGCDSIIVLHVNIPNSNTSPLILSRCDTVTINGILYNQSGNYSQKLISANGCDSILNIELEIQSSSQADYSQTGCDSVIVNNISYTQSGIYQQKLQTAAGCDSTLNIDLKITGSSSRDTIFRSCDSVIINGVTYTQTGIYQQTLINANQCDSILVIDFTRLSKTSTALSFRSCDSLVINNQVYKQSGNYVQVLRNINQCDSVLSLEIEIQSSSQADYSQTGCDSVVVNGQTYFQSGNYLQSLSNSVGCDSILNLEISIQLSSQTDFSQTGCDSVLINGQIYKQSGNFIQLLSTAYGCDSTLNLEIEIQSSSQAEISQTKCDSLVINGKTYTQSGIYKQILQSTNGCDSTLTLDLTIKPGNPSTLDAGVDTSICEGQILKLNGIFNGPASFKWQGARGNFDFTDRLSTNYYSNSVGIERIYLQATDDCKHWLDSLEIQILPNQFVRVTGDTIIDPCKDKEIRFTATGGNNYTWTPSSNIECLDPPCSHVLLKSNLASRFTITTDGPCAFPANLNVSLQQDQSDIYLPNAFSPNGDNINDEFLPIFNCDQVSFYNLQIFDRWGNLMFESTNKDIGWNGKQGEVQMRPGVYPYVVEYELHNNVRKVKSGDVTLIK
jgi:gliding motility-associated-like protein